MKKLDWDRLVPLGVDGANVRDRMALGLGAAAVCSLSFLGHFSRAVNDLYQYRGGVRYQLIDGAKIVPFRDLLHGVFWACGVMALIMMFVAVGFYSYHDQDSKSLYTMKRLPNRMELWRRVLAMPLLGAASCGIPAAVLTGVYYVIYLLCTPAGCLP